MPNLLSAQPSATTFVLEDLVRDVLAGQVRVPHFQRGLRWQWQDVRRLFDSIRKGYPIGSLLFWQRQADKGRIELGQVVIDAPKGPAYWIVDGQQRVTSLANALSDAGHGDTRFALAFDVRKDDFVRPSAHPAPHEIPLPVLFDLQRWMRWFKDHPEIDAPENFDRVSRVAKAIREFKIPAYVVVDQSEDVLRDIFDRMNNSGKRLSRAEVFSALHTAEKKGKDAPFKLTDIAPNVAERTGFGPIDDDTILRAILARRGPDVMREVRAEFEGEKQRDVPNESAETAYRAGEAALVRAIEFLQTKASVPHFGFLPYRYLLVVLTRFFAHFPEPKPRNLGLMRRWFWRAALVGPSATRGSWTGTLNAFAHHIKPGAEDASVAKLLSALEGAPQPYPRFDRFRTNQAETRIILCALWSLRPRSPATGEPFALDALTTSLGDESSAKEALFTFFSKPPEPQRGWAANRAIAFGEDLEDGWPARPANISMLAWKKVLASHVLDEGLTKLLMDGNAEAFLNQRQQKLEAAVRTFLETVTESKFEDTPPLDSLNFDEGERDDALSEPHAPG